jgi:hypothetical protein
MRRRMCHEKFRCFVGQARILAKDCVLDASLGYRRNMRHSLTESTSNRRTYMAVRTMTLDILDVLLH